MDDKNLDVLKKQLEKQEQKARKALLAKLEPEVQEIQVALAELENSLQKRDAAIRFTKAFESMWEGLTNSPDNMVYDLSKQVKELEKAMDGGVNTALSIAKVPAASPLWAQLGTAEYKLRALKRSAAALLAKEYGISPEEANSILEEEKKARQASSKTPSQPVTGQTMPKGGK